MAFQGTHVLKPNSCISSRIVSHLLYQSCYNYGYFLYRLKTENLEREWLTNKKERSPKMKSSRPIDVSTLELPYPYLMFIREQGHALSYCFLKLYLIMLVKKTEATLLHQARAICHN